MKKLLLALALCLISTGAFAQCNGVFNPNTICGNLSALPAPPAMVSASGSVLSNFTPSVANNTALKASCTATSGCPSGHLAFPGGVWRLTFGNANGAEPLWYSPSGSPCSIAAGAGDNGLQVQSADSKCWIAQFSANGASILQWGAIGDNTTDNSTNGPGGTGTIQNAISDWGGRLTAPAGKFCIFSGITVPVSGAASGVSLFAASNLNTIFDVCNHDVTLVTWRGGTGTLSNIALRGCGSHSTDTCTPTHPTLSVLQGAQDTFENLFIVGGLNTIFIDQDANNLTFSNVFATNAYGTANVLIRSGGWAKFIGCQFDQTPPSFLSGANVTIGAWTGSHAYAANTVVTDGSNYIQCTNCNGTLLTGGSLPTVKYYNAPVTDGAVTWQLYAPQAYSGLQCDTGCSVVEINQSDFAGPYFYGVRMSNSQSGTDPGNVTIINSTFSFELNSVIEGDAGNLLTVTGGTNISGCALSSCIGIAVASTWSGGLTVTNTSYNGAYGYFLVNGAGGQSNFSNNATIGATFTVAGYLAENSVTNFSVSNNQFRNFSNYIVVDSGSDFYSITGNISGASTQNANITDGGGSHKTVTGNW